MLDKIKAFILGLYECQGDITTNYRDYRLLEVYDLGRALGRFILGMED